MTWDWTSFAAGVLAAIAYLVTVRWVCKRLKQERKSLPKPRLRYAGLPESGMGLRVHFNDVHHDPLKPPPNDS